MQPGMQSGSLPFVAIGAALLAGTVWFFQRWELVRFSDPDEYQWCKPDVQEGAQRFGRDASWLTPADLEPWQLVRYRLPRVGRLMTSRVVAFEGQRVAMEGGKLVIDGQEVKDPYGRSGNAADFCPETVVPPGCVWVLNDQRGGDRYDSRAFGPLPVGAVSWVFAARPPETGAR